MMDDFIFRARVLTEFWRIISSGKFLLNEVITEFENHIAKFLGVKYAIGVGNCTDALMMSLKACGVGCGDEVIVPALGVMPTINAVVWIGATPVFVDVKEDTLTIDQNLIESAITPKTKAVIAVHLTGQMAAVDKISLIAKKHGLWFIEDGARAIGAKYKGHYIGYWSDAACLSFNPTKILSGYGDGGAVVTNNFDLSEKIRMMRTYGSKSFNEVGISHPVIGNSSRLSAFQASVLLLNLHNIIDLVEKWRSDYYCYLEYLKNTPHLTLPEVGPEYYTNGYQFILLTPKRNELYDFLSQRGVEIKRHYRQPLPYFEILKHLGYKWGDFPISEKISKQELWLPTGRTFSGSTLTKSDIISIAKLVKEFCSVID